MVFDGAVILTWMLRENADFLMFVFIYDEDLLANVYKQNFWRYKQ